jgi:hypothetical protein
MVTDEELKQIEEEIEKKKKECKRRGLPTMKRQGPMGPS